MGGRSSNGPPKGPPAESPLAIMLGLTRHRAAHATDEERKLWRLTMRDVVPLDPTDISALPEPEPIDTTPPLLAPSTPQASPAPNRKTPTPEPIPVLVDRAGTPGVDRRTSEKLRRGLLPIEGRIDLHGMDQHHAHLALAGFITHHWRHGARCVLVITGKGTRGEGVLRQAVPRWLRHPPLSAQVLSFGPARPNDGGGGALYILLRRRRDGERR